MSLADRLRRLLGTMAATDRDADGDGRESQVPEIITCREALERVQEYLDGELDRISHEEVAHHFAICKKCYPHLRLEEQFREMLRRSHEEAGCPGHVRTRILELLSVEDGNPR